MVKKIVYRIMDDEDHYFIEAFVKMFANDNPTTFDKDKFRDAVYEVHSRKNK